MLKLTFCDTVSAYVQTRYESTSSVVCAPASCATSVVTVRVDLLNILVLYPNQFSFKIYIVVLNMSAYFPCSVKHFDMETYTPAEFYAFI